MKKTLLLLLALLPIRLCAQNPIVKHIFTADPAPVVFDGIDSLYVYCDQDENVPGVNDFYYMEHYRCFSTADMVNWTDHGDAVMPRTAFSWLKKGVCWASQCVKKGNYYYWYVCGEPGVSGYGYNVIGVGRASKPSGPFTDPKKSPIISAFGYIDPTVFIDDDGQAYMYFGNNLLSYVKLNSNMTSYKTTGMGSSKGIYNIELTEEAFGGYKNSNDKVVGVDKYEEGPWLDKRGEHYYMMYAAGGVPEHLSYSMSDSPAGPWHYKGQVMKQQDTGSFTNHGGFVHFRGHDYLFYHTGWVSIAGVGGGGFNRSMAVEEFKFNEDGTIPEIKATKTGVKAIANMNPYEMQQAETMNAGENIAVVGNEKKGVYVSNILKTSKISVKSVDFGSEGPASITLRVASAQDNAKLVVRKSSATGTKLATVTIPNTGGLNVWEEITVELSRTITGVNTLFFTFEGTPANGANTLFNFDWWRFNTAEDTPVSTVKADIPVTSTSIYDLSGRRVQQPTRGIYIKNGKKVVK